MLRHKVKAGITGWAQVNGWRATPPSRSGSSTTSTTSRTRSVRARSENHVAHAAARFFSSTHTNTMNKTGQHTHGAAGFIGSHLAETLLDRDYTGHRHRQPADGRHGEHLRTWSTATSRSSKQDVTNYIYVDGPVDLVLHWASPASPIDYLELPIPTVKVGRASVPTRLSAWRRPRARAVRASRRRPRSTAIPLEHPQKETYWGNVNPVGPARRLRRGQALRRGDDDGVPPAITAWTRRSSGSSTPTARACAERRPRRAGVHVAGAAQPRTSPCSRRLADAQLHLHHRLWWTASSC
jgi:hypothetical protein